MRACSLLKHAARADRAWRSCSGATSTNRRGTCRPRARRRRSEHASQPTIGAIGSCTWTTSKRPARSSLRRRTTLSALTARSRHAPFIGSATVRPSGIDVVGQGDRRRARRRCSARVSRSSGSTGRETRTWWPSARNSRASASMWRVTPPGKSRNKARRGRSASGRCYQWRSAALSRCSSCRRGPCGPGRALRPGTPPRTAR